MTDGRKRTASVLATLCITAIGGPMLVAAPTYADQDVKSVQKKVGTLYHQAEQASERYNDARLELKQAAVRLSVLHYDVDRQQAKVDAVRQQLASAVVAQYQGQALSSTTQVLLADDPNGFLGQLSTVSSYNDQQRQVMDDFEAQTEQLQMRQAAAQREVDRIAEAKQQLGTEKAAIDAKAATAKKLLGTLKARAAAKARAEARAAAKARAEARARAEAQASRSADRTATSTSTSTSTTSSSAAPASGRAAAAVSYAMAQVGKAYVWGAAGPSSFDCSGLTMAAWQQAGVSLPHSSSAQMGSGTPVSQSQLQPGDLVFYYSPVSHVGMYIGNGKIVNALNPSVGVKISGVNDMPYSGAVRPG